MKKIVIAVAVLLTGCVVEAPPRVVYVQAPQPAPVEYQAPAPQPVVSVYVDPPLYQPPPIRVEWAPPPMLVEAVPPMPYDDAIWTGGYWVWEGNWVWAHGRWSSPPRPGYGWINPYYENRGGSVVFVNGFWAAPGVSFVAPSLSVNIAFGAVGVGVVAGLRPIGPQGVFVPAPPGSHFGLIVPAPLGTAPAVVTGAPPIVNVGMRVNVNSNNNNNSNNTTTINNIHNVTNVNNITNVTIVAPASATATGQAVNASMPAQAHLAAAVPPVVKTLAPEPASAKPIPAYVPGRQPMALPPAQVVHAEVTPALTRAHAGEQFHPAAAPAHAMPPAPPAPPAQAAQPARPAASPFNEAPARPAAAPNPGTQNQQNFGANPQGAREQQDRFNREREQQDKLNREREQQAVVRTPPAPPAPPAAVQQPRPPEPPKPPAAVQQPRPPEPPRPPAVMQQPRPPEPPRPPVAQQPKPAEKAQKPQEEKKAKEGKPGEQHER